MTARSQIRVRALLEAASEGWTPGRIPSETYVGPIMGSVGLLNRSNARVVELEGVQCLIWHHAEEYELFLEPRMRNPWFPAWHWPCVSRSWKLGENPDDDLIVAEARACIPAVASLQQIAGTAISECEGRTHIFTPETVEPDWGVWAEQYLLANALLGMKFTPATAQNMSTRVRQAAVTYFGGTDKNDYGPVPDRVDEQFCRIGWLAMQILAGQTAVTKPRPNKAFT
ncbi:MAG: hypothetical protein KIT69_12475 [Propionibacteriaceae bacterium]|nr:hypothetical protein [Propionibacteriaceae bacterium]